jgi:hypothetical protein
VEGVKRSGKKGEENGLGSERYAKFVVGAVKKDVELMQKFRELFGSEEEFVEGILEQGKSEMSVKLMQFVLEIMETFEERQTRLEEGKNVNGIEQNRTEDSITNLFVRSQNIASNLIAQKQKIEKTFQVMNF